MELRSRLGRLPGRAWPRGIVALVAVLAVVAAVLPGSASSRDYRGAITGGGAITIRATFEDGRATKMKITWKDVPTTCIPGASFGFTSRGFPAESYSSTTSGTISGAVAPELASAPARSFYLQHVGSANGTVRGVAGRFNKSYSSANGAFAWQEIEAASGFGSGIRSTCSLVRDATLTPNPTTVQTFAATEG
jgi:hypothetical protein